MSSAHSWESRTRRWREQKWLLDLAIAQHGVDWDQQRTAAYSAPCGPEAAADFQAVATRVKKWADLHREYAAAARRRAAKAQDFEAAGRAVAARESWFIAAQLWACARWPLMQRDALLIDTDRQVTACYMRYAAAAAHRVERIEIPFAGQQLPAYLHLPRSGDGPFPCVVTLPGMDNNKEQMVAMHGDKMLERGVAILAVDGPGQAECIARGVRVTADNHAPAAPAIVATLHADVRIDHERLAIRGLSFGSFFCIQMAAATGTAFKGVVSAFVAHEPGLGTLFESASPSFKMRFMLMSGHEDEAEFDRFSQGFDIRPWGERLQSPILIQAGADDELSPLEHTETLMRHIHAPKELVVYEGQKHVLRGGPAVCRWAKTRTPCSPTGCSTASPASRRARACGPSTPTVRVDSSQARRMPRAAPVHRHARIGIERLTPCRPHVAMVVLHADHEAEPGAGATITAGISGGKKHECCHHALVDRKRHPHAGRAAGLRAKRENHAVGLAPRRTVCERPRHDFRGPDWRAHSL